MLPSSEQLIDCTVLVAEDIAMLATAVESMLRNHGAEVVGPCPGLDEVLEAVDAGGFDVALFDVNLRGQQISPAVERCRAKSIPVVVMSGYDPRFLPDVIAGCPHLAKPFMEDELVKMLLTACAETST